MKKNIHSIFNIFLIILVLSSLSFSTIHTHQTIVNNIDFKQTNIVDHNDNHADFEGKCFVCAFGINLFDYYKKSFNVRIFNNLVEILSFERPTYNSFLILNNSSRSPPVV